MENIEHFKEKLLTEQTRLEEELGGVARINPENPEDWEPTAVDMNTMRADKNESADAMAEYEGRAAIEVELENRLKEVRDALIRIEKNTYGTCEVGGEEIGKDRLEANPAARTCIAHLK